MSMINPATDGTVAITDDPNGVELMAGETEEQYVARQQRLKDEAEVDKQRDKAREARQLRLKNAGKGGKGDAE